MINYEAIIINQAYNLTNNGHEGAKYIAQSFDSQYPQQGKYWNCFILPLSNTKCSFYAYNYSIWYSTGNEFILIFV